MKIVGVGAGPGLLTKEAITAIESADVIYSSRRALEIASEHIRCETHEIRDYSLKSLPDNAVVLSTGDPMFSGLGKFAGKKDVIIPGISSLQIACSRLHLDMEDITIITAHSKNTESAKKELLTDLKNKKNIFVLPGPFFGVNEIASLMKIDNSPGEITICERLGYPDEKITTGSVEKPPSSATSMYCIIITNSPGTQ